MNETPSVGFALMVIKIRYLNEQSLSYKIQFKRGVWRYLVILYTTICNSFRSLNASLGRQGKLPSPKMKEKVGDATVWRFMSSKGILCNQLRKTYRNLNMESFVLSPDLNVMDYRIWPYVKQN